jgi:hypothetical protein
MRWIVRKSAYPVDPRKPWAAGTRWQMHIGMGRPFPTWRQAYNYARKCAQ